MITRTFAAERVKGGRMGKPEAPKDARIPLRIPRDVYLEAKKVAADRGQSFNAWLCGVVDEALNRDARVASFKRT
jgi:predicted HicB family RNase H-like nuclease